MSKPTQDSQWWNTSERLAKQVPELTTSRGWRLFAAHYDDPAAVANRLEAVLASRRKKDAAATSAINLASDLGGKLNRNSVVLLFLQDPEAMREGAIYEMAAFIKKLFDPRNTALLRNIASELEDRKSPTVVKKLMLAEGIEAFRAFVLRERRLPNREELSVEANRRFKSEWKEVNFAAAYHFGDMMEGGYVYGIQHRSTTWETPAKILLCPSADWETSRWDMAEVSRSITGPGGLKGIPRKKRTVTKH